MLAFFAECFSIKRNIDRMKIFYTSWPLTILCLAIFQTPLLSLARRSYSGYAIYNVQPISDPQLEFLHRMWSRSEDSDVEFWQLPHQTHELIDVLVAPSARNSFEQELNGKGIPYNVTNEDIQSALEEEVHRDPQPGKRGILNAESYFNFSQYNTWNEVEQYLQKLPTLFPNLVQVETIGQSHENRDLILLKIGSNAVQTKKPAVWIDAGIHAREWISTATILYVIDSILNYYEGDETVQRYLDSIDWYFLPVMNPDGYAFSHTKDRMWRKNRSPAVCKARKCCQGVDLNRNFPTQWGVAGASRNPCSEVYLGPKPFSEPETRAVRDFVMTHADRLKAYFTFHSYGQLWLYPYGYKRRTYPEDVEELRKLSLSAVENMRSVHGTRYKVGTAANILYPSSGGADDWAKAEAGIKYVFSIELRPSAGRGNGFLVHPRNIIPTGEETWAGIRAVADRILSKYGTEDPTGTATPDPSDKETTRKSKYFTTTPPESEVATTDPTEEEVDEVEEETEEQCYDLSSRCAHLEEDTDKCSNNVVRAICRKLCRQC